MTSESAIHLDFISLVYINEFSLITRIIMQKFYTQMFNFIFQFLDSMGLIFIVFCVAFGFMIFFENPFIRLTKLLQGK